MDYCGLQDGYPHCQVENSYQFIFGGGGIPNARQKILYQFIFEGGTGRISTAMQKILTNFYLEGGGGRIPTARQKIFTSFYFGGEWHQFSCGHNHGARAWRFFQLFWEFEIWVEIFWAGILQQNIQRLKKECLVNAGMASPKGPSGPGPKVGVVRGRDWAGRA